MYPASETQKDESPYAVDGEVGLLFRGQVAVWLLGLDSPPHAANGASCGATGDSPWKRRKTPSRCWLAALDDFRNWLIREGAVSRPFLVIR